MAVIYRSLAEVGFRVMQVHGIVRGVGFLVLRGIGRVEALKGRVFWLRGMTMILRMDGAIEGFIIRLGM